MHSILLFSIIHMPILTKCSPNMTKPSSDLCDGFHKHDLGLHFVFCFFFSRQLLNNSTLSPRLRDFGGVVESSIGYLLFLNFVSPVEKAMGCVWATTSALGDKGTLFFLLALKW